MGEKERDVVGVEGGGAVRKEKDWTIPRGGETRLKNSNKGRRRAQANPGSPPTSILGAHLGINYADNA
jgi:hypothetical protein